MAYIALMAVLATLGCLAVWLKDRRPTRGHDPVREFRRGLDALAPRGPRADERA